MFSSRFLPVVTLVTLFIFNSLISCKKDPQEKDWAVYLGDNSSSQFADLKQINSKNVKDLEVTWVYRTGDADSLNRTQIQCNPLIIEGVLYGSSPKLKFFALNAATGQEKWMFDPFEGGYDQYFMSVNRGVAYWSNENEKRLLLTAGPHLYALDAITGNLIPDFGLEGKVDLREGLGKDAADRFVVSNTPGIVYKNLLILGTRVDEGFGAAPGHVRAYNIVTGKQEWIFHTIPQPGEFGYDTWPEDAWERVGGANAWAGMSLDADRGMVFVPTGSASYDFYGADRHGQNLFANCIIALDAESGERKWHFQTVHHDLWDRDIPAPPNLVTIEQDGKKIDVVAQITKTGYVFVLDRETGQPVFPIEEEPVPPSGLYGEDAWPTQPRPTKPPAFVRQDLTLEDLNDMDPESHAFVSEMLNGKDNQHMYFPPSESGTVIFPGYDGGGEWGGAAHDPVNGKLYVNANEMPWLLTMVPVFENETDRFGYGKGLYMQFCASCHGMDRKGGEFMGTIPSLADIKDRIGKETLKDHLEKGRGNMPSFAWLAEYQTDLILDYLWQADSISEFKENLDGEPERYLSTGYIKFKDQEGYPAVKPPWGTLSSIDLSEGVIEWQVSLGEHAELLEKGCPPTGTENYGGPVVTSGNVLFIAATQDEKFRAFDPRNGKLLWEVDLPAAGYATPATYAVDGRQFVVIACGGGKLGTKSGDTYVAYALPK